jgi:hypothetical protein
MVHFVEGSNLEPILLHLATVIRREFYTFWRIMRYSPETRIDEYRRIKKRMLGLNPKNPRIV